MCRNEHISLYTRFMSYKESLLFRSGMEYIAYIRQKDQGIQTVEYHLKEAQAACERLDSKIGIPHQAG